MKFGFHSCTAAVLVIATLAAAAQANPVPESTAKVFNSLPREVVEEGSDVAKERLTRFFGLFGVDLLEPRTLDYMDRHLNALKAIMVEAQRPPAAPSVRLQDWYRERAHGPDRRLRVLDDRPLPGTGIHTRSRDRCGSLRPVPLSPGRIP